MARKLIATIPAKAPGALSAKVYRDPDTYGFVVLYFKDGKHQSKADYETDDKADAMQTAGLCVEMSGNAKKG